jgi:hypothetical protein
MFISRGIALTIHGQGGGGSVFSPVSLFAGGKLGALYDISDLSTLFSDRSATPVTPAVIDGVVGTIKDKSGNSNHAIAPSDAARGILRNSGPLYWVEMDGTDDAYAVTAVNVTTNMSSVFAFARNAAATHSVGFGKSGGAAPYAWWWFSDNTVYEAMGVGDSAGAGSSTATGNFYGTTIRNVTNTVRRRNGVQIGTRASPVVGGNFNSLGLVGTAFTAGKIYAAMLVNSELAGADLTNAETWFAARAGLP